MNIEDFGRIEDEGSMSLTQIVERELNDSELAFEVEKLYRRFLRADSERFQHGNMQMVILEALSQYFSNPENMLEGETMWFPTADRNAKARLDRKLHAIKIRQSRDPNAQREFFKLRKYQLGNRVFITRDYNDKEQHD